MTQSSPFDGTVLLSSLTQSIRDDIRGFLEDNPGPVRNAYEKDGWNAKVKLADVLDAYLTWNGIHGYTGKIMHIFRMARPE